MTKRSLLRLLAGGLIVFLCAPAGSPAQKTETAVFAPVLKFDPKRDPAKDVADAQVEAQRSGRRILLDVGGEWCVWCRRLDSLFVRHKGLHEQLHAGFVVVKVNFSPENKNEKFLSRFPKIPGYPHLFVLDEKGMLLHSQDTGALESGKGHDPVKVRAFLDAWGKPILPTER